MSKWIRASHISLSDGTFAVGGVALAEPLEEPLVVGAVECCSSCRNSRGLPAVDESDGGESTGVGIDPDVEETVVSCALVVVSFFCTCVIRSRMRSVQTLEGLRDGVVDLRTDLSGCVVSLTIACMGGSSSFGAGVSAAVIKASLCFGLDSLSCAWVFWLAALRSRSAYETFGADLDVCVVVHAHRDILGPTRSDQLHKRPGRSAIRTRGGVTSSRRRMRQGAQLRPARICN